MNMLYHETRACRSCGSNHFSPVLNLGTPYISDFINEGDAEDRAPLELIYCHDCTLVQLRHTVYRDRLYRNYFYQSSTNESMVAALRSIVDYACHRVPLSPDDMALDTGCNDGTLLSMYPRNIWCHGYEPAVNIAKQAVRNAHARIFPTYFPPPWYNHIKYKIITSIAMFYDVDSPNEFVHSIRECLHKDGIWIVQFQDLTSMLSCNGFDNVCHEHLTYWSPTAFAKLLHRQGMHIADVSYNHTNGGSVRYTVKHGVGDSMPADTITLEDLANFQQRVINTRAHTLKYLDNLLNNQYYILGYGASTKGNTLLQYYGIDSDMIPAIADRNPAKHGKITVGSHIPIFSEETIRDLHPDYLFILPWHFIEPFMQREAEYLHHGGQFIVPLPDLHIIGTHGGIPCQLSAGELSAKNLADSISGTQHSVEQQALGELKLPLPTS